MMNFYKYLIYKLFNWRISKGDDTPEATVILLISVTHIFQLLSTLALIAVIFPGFTIFDNLPGFLIFSFFIFFILLNYFLLYNKKRWARFIEEFRNEGKEESKKGWIKVIVYLIGSVILFFMLMPVFFGF